MAVNDNMWHCSQGKLFSRQCEGLSSKSGHHLEVSIILSSSLMDVFHMYLWFRPLRQVRTRKFIPIERSKFCNLNFLKKRKHFLILIT